MSDDSDETDGRKLYRARADKLATSQEAMAKRRITMKSSEAISDSLTLPSLPEGATEWNVYTGILK